MMSELSERTGERYESLQEASAERLPYLLQKFLQSATKVGGQVYSSGSLNTLVNGISNYLKSREVDPVDVKYDFRFKKVHEMLRVRTRVSASEGRGTGCNAKRAVTQAHLAAALEIGSIGRNGPKSLTAAAYLAMVIGMGCRTGAECYMIRNGDLTIGPLSERTGVPQYIELAERITKTRKGNQGDERELTPRIFPDDEYPETCYVRTVMEFQKRKTPAQLKPDSPFFLTLNQGAVQDPGRYQYWYYNGIMGVHTVKALLTDALELAGIDCKVHRYSAISLRKAMLQSGVDCGVPDMHLSRLAGHKSLVSKKDYIRSSGPAHEASSLSIRRNLFHNVNKGYDEEMRNLSAGNKDDSMGSRPVAREAVGGRSREAGRSRSGDRGASRERSRSRGRGASRERSRSRGRGASRERSRSQGRGASRKRNRTGADGTSYKQRFGNREATGERSRSRSRSWKAGTERRFEAGGADREMSRSRSRDSGRERRSWSGEAGRERRMSEAGEAGREKRKHGCEQDWRERRRSQAGEAGRERRRSQAGEAGRERRMSEAGEAGRERRRSEAGEAGMDRSKYDAEQDWGERRRSRPRSAGWQSLSVVSRSGPMRAGREKSLSRPGGASGARQKFGGFVMDQDRSGECDQRDGRESRGWGGGMTRRELGSWEDSEYRRELWGSYGARRESDDWERDRRRFKGQEGAMTWRVSQDWGDIGGAWEEEGQGGGRSWRQAKDSEDKGYWGRYRGQEESMTGRKSGDWEGEQPWRESGGWEEHRRDYGGWGEGGRDYGGLGEGVRDYGGWGDGGRDYGDLGEGVRDYGGWGEVRRNYEVWGEGGRVHWGLGEGGRQHGGLGEGGRDYEGWGEVGREHRGLGEGGREHGASGEGGREHGGWEDGVREPGSSEEDKTVSESWDEDRRVSKSWEEDKSDLESDDNELMQSQQELAQAEAEQKTAETSCPEKVCNINIEIKRLQEKILVLQKAKDQLRGEKLQTQIRDTAQDLRLEDGLISPGHESQVGLNCWHPMLDKDFRLSVMLKGDGGILKWAGLVSSC